jgi:hypothetical protein
MKSYRPGNDLHEFFGGYGENADAPPSKDLRPALGFIAQYQS